jgi:hypothetical protein
LLGAVERDDANFVRFDADFNAFVGHWVSPVERLQRVNTKSNLIYRPIRASLLNTNFYVANGQM